MDATISFLSERVTTERLVLEQPSGIDVHDVQAFFMENRVFHAPWEPLRDDDFYELEHLRSMLIRQDIENLNGTALYLYLKRTGEDEVIGSVALSNIIYGAFRSCFLGYRIARSQTSHGYMTEAVEQVIHIAFERYRLHRIEANIMPGNHASVRLVEKLGFVEEGYSSRYLKVAGVWEGHCHFVLLNDALEHL